MTGGWQVADQPQADTAGDFVTAQAVASMHRPYIDAQGVARCASASHQVSRYGPRWPCLRWQQARRAIAAHDRAKTDQGSVEPVVTS